MSTLNLRAASEVETMLLRFRDLATLPGDTINRHAELVESAGEVWWGWWAKGGERVPEDVFRELAGRAERGLPILLFDSGHNAVHEAVCSGIEWSPKERRIPSPDPAKTPKYYREQHCLAWFRLSTLSREAAPEPRDTLRGFAYTRVDDFFTTRSSRYDAFYGKQVSSPDELRGQERSIWFVRAFRSGDHTHEVSLLDARVLQPSHFPSSFQQSPSLNLLWLSDVHFRRHAFPTEATETAQPLAVRLETACRVHGVTDLAGLILSGDLTWQASAEGFADARALVQQTTSWARLDNYQVAVCPGNHDVTFAAVPETEGAPATRAPEEASRAYAQFYEQLFYLHPNEYLSCGRRLLLRGAVPVELVCLNSSLLHQSAKEFQGHGFIGDAQLENAAEEMGWNQQTEGPLPVRIVVVHHHLLPVTYRANPIVGTPYSVALDAEALTRWAIRHRVRAVLHGHMHNPFYSVIERPLDFGKMDGLHRLHVFGLGSSGVALDQVDREYLVNMFAVLRFGTGELAVTYYSVDPDIPSKPIASYTIPLAG